MSAINAEHVDKICKPGQKEATCAFLTMGVGMQWMCAKATPAVRLTIEARLEEGSMSAKGDNCPGWLT